MIYGNNVIHLNRANYNFWLIAHMIAIAAQVSEKYQVVIPREVRQHLKLQPRDTLLFLIDGATVIVRPRPASFTTTLRGLHQELWADLDVDEWLQQERSAWA
jgi:AbrB family looped-hinge helix DNA binding protein